MALDEVLKLTGLKDKLFGPDPAQVLLNQIKDELANVNARLTLISTQISELAGEFRTKEVNDDLAVLCNKVAQVEGLFHNHFVGVLSAGIAVGELWHYDDAAKYVKTEIGDLPAEVKQKVYPQAGDATCPPAPSPDVGPDKNLLVCNTPLELVSYRLTRFRETFRQDDLDYAPALFSSYLTVHDSPASILTHYGLYLMKSRTLNHHDSVVLRDIYDQFSQAEALAAWMSIEYHNVTTAETQTAEDVLKAYKHDRDDLELKQLPPLIPEGDVIDLGAPNGSSTRHQPIWTLASTKDQTYWPTKVESNDSVTDDDWANGAPNAVKAFDDGQSCSAQSPPCYKAWKIPSTIELKSLLSTDCQLTGTPPKLPKTCTPVTPSSNYPNVANYLVTLDPTDNAWKGVFCSGLAVACATPADEHTFIWATDTRSHETKCGYQTIVFVHIPWSRTYALRVGLPLKFTKSPLTFTSLNQTWPIYPIMPSQLPSPFYNLSTPSEAHLQCDTWTSVELNQPSNEGIVLVTDNTGDVDFMAQPAKAAVQDTTARGVANQAAADAKRYGRHHHGSFRGLSLRRLRHKIAEGRSGEPGYLIAAHPIDGGAGFVVTATGEATEDTFTITQRPSGSLRHTCTRVHGGAGRHGCEHLRKGHGRW